MVKVSITLPNNAQITCEAEEPEVLLQIIQIALRDLPRDLMQAPVPSNGPVSGLISEGVMKRCPMCNVNIIEGVEWCGNCGTRQGESQMEEKGNNATIAIGSRVSRALVPGIFAPESRVPAEDGPTPVPTPGTRLRKAVSGQEKGPSAHNPLPRPQTLPGDGRPTAAIREAFVEFCQSANPLTDMRRLVVAVEGASRILGLDSVDAEELGRLFDLAGWRRPHSVVQTLRNAARRKFQWIESIPGRSGHYTVTNQGRAVVLGG